MDQQIIENVALLARLELTESEVDALRNDIGKILHYVEQLDSLPTDDVDPLAHPGDIVNALREDKVEPSLERDSLLKNAPKKDGQFYLVPAVLGESGKS